MKPPPRFIGYPRNSEYGINGVYGSVKRLEALKSCVNLQRWSGGVSGGTMPFFLRHHTVAFNTAGFWFMAVFALLQGLFFYGIYATMADARGFSRAWAIVLGCAVAANPFIWAWAPLSKIGFVGYFTVLCALAIPITVLSYSEAKRYGFKFTRKDPGILDRVIAYRQQLEARPPEVPADLYSGKTSSSSYTTGA